MLSHVSGVPKGKMGRCAQGRYPWCPVLSYGIHCTWRIEPVIYSNQSLLYNVLYHAASDTLCNLASDKKYLGADIGYICILNTWGSAMNFHPHIHAIVLGGGLDAGNRWKDNGEDFFLPVKVVSRVFRGKYLAELKRLWSEEKLEFHGTAEPYKNHYAFKELLNACYHKEWIPYCKKPFQSCRHICRKVRRSCRSHGERSLTGYRKSMRRLWRICGKKSWHFPAQRCLITTEQMKCEKWTMTGTTSSSHSAERSRAYER